MAYRLARSRNPHWRIGPARIYAYKRILEQLPTTVPIRANTNPLPVLVRETIGALREHLTHHAAGSRHTDAVIVAAVTGAHLDQVTMPVTLTDTTIELLCLLHDIAPDNAVLADLLRRILAQS